MTPASYLRDFLCGWVEGSVKMAAAAMCEAASDKEAISEGLLDLLRPTVQQLDLHVHSVR